MAGMYNLAVWEVGMIRRLLLDGAMNKQQILSYFTRPGRDLNHKIIAEISHTAAMPGAALPLPASPADRDRFLTLRTVFDARHFRAVESMLLRSTSVFRFGYTFHPVGQGLFTSGWFTRRGKKPFRWVYDCGSATKGGLVTQGLDRLEDEIGAISGQKLRLDLVVVSHFDHDHVSGLLDLLSRFRVGILLLPYLTPLQRLLVALEEDAAAGSDLLAFLTAPTAFLLDRVGEGGIERIILVPGGEGPADPALETPLPDPDTPGEEGPFSGPEFEEIRLPREDTGDETVGLGTDDGLISPRVGMLRPRCPLTVGRCWEFVPYNDARHAPPVPMWFQAAALPLAQALQTSQKSADRAANLASLKKLYDRTFGASAHRRNIISLFLYSSPIGIVSLIQASEVGMHADGVSWCEGPEPCSMTPDRFGQMLTGDGFLNTQPRLDAFTGFYGPARMARGGCFQVMHHGATANWLAGLPAQVKPRVSLFSSDPARKKPGHPHKQVWDDFAPYHPRQIDARRGWGLEGTFLFC